VVVVTKVQKWGNSQGVRLSKELLAGAEIKVGDAVDVAVREGVLVVTPVRRVRGGHDLAELTGGVDKGYQPAELDWGGPVGKEVW
jgi:antitoxin MazE